MTRQSVATLTPALSHRMGEGESSSVGRRIQPLWKRRETGLAVPSPVGRERVRVRVILFELRFLSDICFCTNPKIPTACLRYAGTQCGSRRPDGLGKGR